jgi:Protein of unknown function (DUF3562)
MRTAGITMFEVSQGCLMTNLQEQRAAFQPQQLKWQVLAKDLAKDFSCPLSEVEQILSIELLQLEQEARIKEFVTVLAVKRAKDLLRPNRRSG